MAVAWAPLVLLDLLILEFSLGMVCWYSSNMLPDFDDYTVLLSYAHLHHPFHLDVVLHEQKRGLGKEERKAATTTSVLQISRTCDGGCFIVTKELFRLTSESHWTRIGCIRCVRRTFFQYWTVPAAGVQLTTNNRPGWRRLPECSGEFRQTTSGAKIEAMRSKSAFTMTTQVWRFPLLLAFY